MHTITNSDSSTTTDTTTTTDQSETEIATITDIASSGSTTVGSNDIGGNYLGVNTNTLTQIESYSDSGPSLTLTGASTLSSTQSSSGNGNGYTGNYIFTSSETDTGTDSDSGVAGTRTFSDSGSTSSTTTARDSGNSVNQTDTITSTQTDHSTTTHTDTYTGGGADTQTLTASDTLTTTQSSNAATGDYTTTNIDSASDNTHETGSDANTYTLSATDSSSGKSTENGNAVTGAYTLTTSSTDTDSTTRTGTDTAGNTFAITQSDSSSGTVNTTGNNLVGDYTAIAIGTDTLATDENISGTGNSETLHQVVSGTSTLTNTGNDYSGDFSTTNYETNATTLIQSGYNTSGTYSLNEAMSDSPTIVESGNNVDGTQTYAQSGTQDYTLTQTNTSGTSTYTLTGTGSKPYTITGDDDANTGDSARTETGTDGYTLTQTGTASGSSFSLVLTGSDGYTTDSDMNSQSGAFATTTTGTGTYTKTGTGAGSGTTSFSSTEIGSTRDADVTLTNSGTSRYNLLVGFSDTSDAGNGTAGIADFSPVGLPVLVGRASVPAGIFSSLGDARYKYCFAAETLVLMADRTLKLIYEVKRGDMVLAVPEGEPQAPPRPCRVVEVYHNAPARLLHVYACGESIRGTENHPFYVKGKGWTFAGRLVAGDQLRAHDGSWVAVEKVEDSGQVEPVFNLSVAGSRTYFVQVSGGRAVLVHNTSIPFSDGPQSPQQGNVPLPDQLTRQSQPLDAQPAPPPAPAAPKGITPLTGPSAPAPTNVPNVGMDSGPVAPGSDSNHVSAREVPSWTSQDTQNVTDELNAQADEYWNPLNQGLVNTLQAAQNLAISQLNSTIAFTTPGSQLHIPSPDWSDGKFYDDGHHGFDVGLAEHAIGLIAGAFGGEEVAGERSLLKIFKLGCFCAGTGVLCNGGLRGIEEIRTGQRVVTTAGEQHGSSIDADAYRLIRLSIVKDGQELEMTFLRPAYVVEGLAAGDTIQLSVMELEVRGRARVLAIEPCPPIEGGNGRIVTGTIRGQSVDVRLLKLRGMDAPIEVTGNHPIFSEDRRDFVLVNRLIPGERLRTRDGEATVESVTRKYGQWDIFNLEIDDAHQYYVSEQRVLVHNANGVLPSVNKAINSGIVHAADQAVEKGIVAATERAQVVNELKDMSQNITKAGFPSGTVRDPGNIIPRFDSVLVPFRGGAAVYEVAKNGTAKLRTLLNAGEFAIALGKLHP